jgi:hypothetical protein
MRNSESMMLIEREEELEEGCFRPASLEGR